MKEGRIKQYVDHFQELYDASFKQNDFALALAVLKEAQVFESEVAHQAKVEATHGRTVG